MTPRLEGASVIGNKNLNPGLLRDHMVGVNEIKPALLRYPLEYGTSLWRTYLVPAHVGHLHTLILGAEPNDFPPEDPESPVPQAPPRLTQTAPETPGIFQEKAARFR